MFEALFVPQPLLEGLTDAACVQAMLDAERALARAEARAEILSPEAADAISAACDVSRFDVPGLVAEGRAPGNPVEPLVRSLRAEVGDVAAEWVHWGATSQDILDTALMLVARRSLALVAGDLDRLAAWWRENRSATPGRFAAALA